MDVFGLCEKATRLKPENCYLIIAGVGSGATTFLVLTCNANTLDF